MPFGCVLLLISSPTDGTESIRKGGANTINVLVNRSIAEGLERNTADHELYLWAIGIPELQTVRFTYYTGNDCWPELYLRSPLYHPTDVNQSLIAF